MAVKVKNIKDILNAGYNSILNNLNEPTFELQTMIQSMTTDLVNQNIELQIQISAQICDSALLLQSRQQLNRQITQQNKNMANITDEILDVIQSLRTAANVPQNAGLNQTLNTDITNLNKSLNAVTNQLSLSQTNAQTEVRHLLAQNNCANITTVSSPTPSQSTPKSTTQVHHSVHTFSAALLSIV